MLLLDITFGVSHVSGCFFQLQICQNTEQMTGLLNHLFIFDKSFTRKFCTAEYTGRNLLKVPGAQAKHQHQNEKLKHPGENSATAHQGP
ncbi:unnamed protein product, partial [Allacma fusca]